MNSALREKEKHNYFAPCPPRGDKPHRYFFKLYALDTIFNFPQTVFKNNIATKDYIEKNMRHTDRDHVLAEAVLMGTYQRK